MFHLADGVFAEMEDARGEHGVGLAFAQHFHHVLEPPGAAAGDDGHADRFADPAGDRQVVAGSCAIGVDRVEHDLAGAELADARRPFDRVEPGRLCVRRG